ncbi:MAG: DUF99 family protein [Deltaproteobacteria bacterium]|nr:DUF99 family protein [Deltaproteobacteria bacterium]
MRRLTNVIGFDDAPFGKDHRGDILLIGAVCSRTRLDGVVSGMIRRDGANSTDRMIELIQGTQFREHVRAVLLQGIAVGGFNVVDVRRLHEVLEVPVVVVARRRPDFVSIRRALTSRVRGADRKWALIRAAGEIERIGDVCVQRVGIERDETLALLRATTLHGHIPEALRLAHIIAGGVTTGKSRGRA